MKTFSPVGSRWALLLLCGWAVLSTEASVLITENLGLPAGENSLENQEVIVEGATLTLAGSHRFRSLQLLRGAVLTHPAAPRGEVDHAIRLTLTGDLVVDETSRIEVTGAGYAVAGTPGAATRGGFAGGGGGHGGVGSFSAGSPAGDGGPAHGSIVAPDSWGGPGANGANDVFAPGGGIVRLEVGGDMTLAGTIRGNGANASVDNQGGGAGGTVSIRCTVFRGGGSITVDGGNGEWVEGGGGGGGRIAVFFQRQEFTGALSANGGGGSRRAGAGTIYLKPVNWPGEVIVRNASAGGATPLLSAVAFDLSLGSGAVVYPTESLELGRLVLSDNAVLMQAAGSTGMVVRVLGDVAIGSGAALHADGMGYPLGDNPGPGAGIVSTWAGSGAGHGGLGGGSATGAVGGGSYGSVLEPVSMGSQGGAGSGGSGAAGGGAIRLLVGGTLTVEGRLTAEGHGAGRDNTGGGSGGSLWLQAAALEGTGTISVNGGAGEWVEGGGAGGGRIAIYTTADRFAGTLSAKGGGGRERGGAGTIYRRRTDEAEGLLTVDNGGAWGQLTPISSPEAYRVVVTNQAVCYPSEDLKLARLQMSPNSILTHLTGQPGMRLEIAGDFLIADGAQVTADGKGYSVFADGGPGFGVPLDWAGSGGGHGGLGGRSRTGSEGGVHYGSMLQPTALGSQGGAGSGGAGAAGGGAIRLLVSGRLHVDGRLSANGLNASADNAGGGAGGSLWLTVGALSGKGVIQVDGGAGEWVEGGGGAGGRVAVYYGTNDFEGSLTASGSGGNQRGGAGTLYRRQTGKPIGELLVNNGGAWGNYTPLEAPEVFDLVLASNAWAYPVTALEINSLEVREQATLTHLTGQTNLALHVRTDLSVRAGGNITANGRGYPVGEERGPGSGLQLDSGGSGAGHGGLGGVSRSGAAAGMHYGNMLEPVLRGSQGGNGSGGAGRPGGGAIRLVVDGQLTVDGAVTADGDSSTIDNSGGGSGGSIWLTVGSLKGTGIISANGGSGEWVDGGGGGGGRVAVHYGSDDFRGAVTTYGGGGNQRGGAGTIHRRAIGQASGELRVHNGGIWGNYTPITSPEPFHLVLAEMASVYPEAPLQVRELTLQTNTFLTHLTGQPVCQVHVIGNLTVAPGGVISADGRGFPVGTDRGPGAGAASGLHGSGAGHGGRGGVARSGIEGGLPYGSIPEPVTHGSQGGDGSGGPGGAGGGAVRLIVDNELILDGRVSAEGLGGRPDNAGGGSGGSVYITAKSMAGSGEISVNGGTGEWVDGGGGGGGRIALHLDRSSFSGSLQARGGGGHARGGAGTLYSRIGGEPGGELVLENGGSTGAFGPLEVPPSTRLVLAAGASVYPARTLALTSLRLNSGATLTHNNDQSGLAIEVVGDLTVEAGATITANGKGYPVGADNGPGAGDDNGTFGAGGAHGGNGGMGRPATAGGGIAYGSVIEPTHFGSSGGPGGGSTQPRSSGGGAIRIQAGGTLTVDGAITANGTGAWYDNQGGGGGGSIWITAAHLAGAGEITANGGSGEWVDGGSGGGGRVALHLGSSAYSGLLSAQGGGGGYQVGGAGTVYTRLADQSVGQVLVENGGRWGAYTPLLAPEPFHLTLENMAQGYAPDPLVVGSLNVATNTLISHLQGQDAFRAVVLGDASIQGAIDVSGRGFPIGSDRGPGAGSSQDWAGGGAGHGGMGALGRTGASGGTDYGSSAEPLSLGSQGGAGSGGPGGHGGGAVRLIVGGALTLDGSIAANGLNGAADNAGGGSGGSILVSSRILAGAGHLTANGGAGEWVDGGGGAGGRIALYRTAETFTGTVTVTGAGGYAKAEDGTIHRGSVAGVVWLSPSSGWLRGNVRLEVAFFAGSTEPATVVFDLWRAGVASRLAAVTSAQLAAAAAWDTSLHPDGYCELEATVLDAHGARLASARRSVLVHNGVDWHGGILTTNEIWSPGRIHVVERDLTVASGVTLALQPGVVVKFLPGTRLILQANARLDAPGTATLPILLTAFQDDTAGGDSNLDGEETRPQPGTWRFVAQAGSTFDSGEGTRLRYQSQTYGGVLPSDETWPADTLREIGENLVVPSGVTLRIEGGAVVKFARDRGLDIQSGGRLVVAGTAAQPVVFTSDRDDAFGGDSNGDGSRSIPGAGDWRSLRFADGSSGTIEHANIRFGGNSVGNPWGAGGVIEALGGTLTVRNSILADALKDGAFCYGNTRFENCLVLRCDRGLTAVGTMDVIHCTIDQCRIGLLEHVGQLNVRNSIVSRSIHAGIEHDLGGGVAVVTHCNVWNPEATRGNYSGLSDRLGRDGNIGAQPRYRDPDADNFRLNFTSPGIDAADGTWSSETDYSGTPRYDDPRTGNTGTPAGNGAIPDIGAFEFAESAPSNLDLAVASVTGPAAVVAGTSAQVQWTILNRGTDSFTGPWHDAIYLRHATSGLKLLVAEPLVGAAVTLGPGQTYSGVADVRIPGGVAADYVWVVEANSRGDVFEGANAANNEGSSVASSKLSLREVPLDGSPVSGSFAAQEEQHWFRVVAPAGRDVRLALDLGSDLGVSEIYVGRGFVPTPDNFTVRHREFGAPDTSAIAPGTGESFGNDGNNDFYVLVVGRVLPSVPVDFGLSAASAAFGIESVANGPVGNSGEVTLDIRGAGFASETLFTLRSGVQERTALRTSIREAGRAYATFDLRGIPAGTADLVATLGELSSSKAGVVPIREGGTGDFYVSLGGPGTTRAGRFSPWYITYGNRGLIDVRLPLLRLQAPGASEFQIFDNTLNWADSLTVLALHRDILLPTLGPGQEATFEVRIKSMVPLNVRIDVLGGDEFDNDETLLDWNSLPAPEGAEPSSWSEMIATLPSRLGVRVADYRRLLDQDLAEMRADPTQYTYLANVNGRWLFGDELETEPEIRPIIELPPQADDAPAGPGLQSKPAKKPGDGIRKTWWVVIQIRGYDALNISDLNNVEADFRDIGNYLIRDLRVPTNQIVGGIDRQGPSRTWNRQAVLDAIASLKGQIDADDNLVISYSGHGGRTANGTGYMCLNGDNMSAVTLQRAIDDVGAGTTYLINDSCHSEAFNNAVQPANTTFVGFAGSKSGRVAWDDPNKGGYLLSGLKSRLRKCHSLGLSMDLTEQTVAHTFANRPAEKDRQHPVLSNPSGASLEGKPWNDPSGYEQVLRRTLNTLRGFRTWQEAVLNLVGSVDPNEKYALAGVGPEHWVQPGQILPFEVLFENKTNAAAPAQEVLVTDDLDPRLDWSTFELSSISFNDTRISVPAGRQRFTTTTQVGTDPYPVDVDVSLNPASGRITCLIRSRDPATGDLPEDPFAGFLPPNDPSHRGEGGFTYTVRARADLSDGTILTNRANIIFDPTYGANPPILTPVATNTIDGLAPFSVVAPLPAQAIGELPVQWSGDDAPGGSGIASYDIYVSRDSDPFHPWLLATTATQATFTGVPGSTYRFYSVARDRAGNTESAPTAPDTAVAIGGGAVGPVSIVLEGVHLRVTFTGILQSAPAVTGPWIDVPGASSPLVVMPSAQAAFFRARR